MIFSDTILIISLCKVKILTLSIFYSLRENTMPKRKKLDGSSVKTPSNQESTHSTKKSKVKSFLFPVMTKEEKQIHEANLEKLRNDLQGLGLSPPHLVRYP